MYTNVQITIDNYESGILTSNISDHFFDLGNTFHRKIYIKIHTKNEKLNMGSLDHLNKAQDPFSLFYDFFYTYVTFENIFSREICRDKIKRKAEREYISNQLEINKSDMRKS